MVNKVKGKLEELARERAQLNAEKLALQKEKSELKAQVTELAASVQKLNREKVDLEQSLEAEEEQVSERGRALRDLAGASANLLCGRRAVRLAESHFIHMLIGTLINPAGCLIGPSIMTQHGRQAAPNAGRQAKPTALSFLALPRIELFHGVYGAGSSTPVAPLLLG